MALTGWPTRHYRTARNGGYAKSEIRADPNQEHHQTQDGARNGKQRAEFQVGPGQEDEQQHDGGKTNSVGGQGQRRSAPARPRAGRRKRQKARRAPPRVIAGSPISGASGCDSTSPVNDLRQHGEAPPPNPRPWPPAPGPRYNLHNAPGTGGRKLRRGRAPARPVSCRPESADRRDRQRQIHRRGRPRAAAGRARFGRNGPHRRAARARGRHLRGAGPRPPCAACWNPPASKSKTANCWSSARSWPAASRARSSAAVPWPPRCSRIWPAPGRYPRPARSADSVLARRAARHAGRLRRAPRAARPHRRPLSANGAPPRAELEELERSEQEKLRLLDLWSFQRKEIEAAALRPDEDAALENERRVLQNVQRLQEAAATAYAAVYDGPESAVSLARAGRPAPGRVVPHRCLARRPARAPESRRPQPAGSLLRPARLSLRAGSQPRPPGGDGNAPRRHRQAEAQVRPLDRRNPGLPRGGPRADRGRGARRRAHGGIAQPAPAPGRRVRATGRRADRPPRRRRAQAGKARRGGTGAARHGAHRLPRRSRRRRMGRPTARTASRFWSRRTSAKSPARSKRWPPAARFRASRWR